VEEGGGDRLSVSLHDADPLDIRSPLGMPSSTVAISEGEDDWCVGGGVGANEPSGGEGAARSKYIGFAMDCSLLRAKKLALLPPSLLGCWSA